MPTVSWRLKSLAMVPFVAWLVVSAAPALLVPPGAWSAEHSVALLLGVVYVAFWLAVPRRWSIALGLLTVPLAFAATSLPINSSAVGQLWIYPALALGFAAPESMTATVVLVVAALALITSLRVPGTDLTAWDMSLSHTRQVPYLLVQVAASALITGGARRLLLANEKLADAQQQLAASAVQEERSRFARDLHDLLGHSLTVLVAKVRLARRLPPGERDAELADAERIAVSALDDVRQAVEGYRTPTLDSQIAGARVALAAAGIGFAVSGSANPVGAEAEGALAISVREAVTNVVRHSGAHHCSLTIGRSDDAAWVEVQDDGRGAGAGPVSGLAGIRDRLTKLGGTTTWGPAVGGGFTVHVSVPAEPIHAAPVRT